MLAFVTGATGFLGSHVARVLAEQGAELRLLVRPTSDLRNLDGLAADRVVGDLRDSASIEKALSGCDVVFHVAADYRLWVRGRDSNEMYRSNVEGTRAVLEAARKQGVRRVVYTSSVAPVGFISTAAAAELPPPVKPTPGLTGAPVRSAWTGQSPVPARAIQITRRSFFGGSATGIRFVFPLRCGSYRAWTKLPPTNAVSRRHASSCTDAGPR